MGNFDFCSKGRNIDEDLVRITYKEIGDREIIDNI